MFVEVIHCIFALTFETIQKCCESVAVVFDFIFDWYQRRGHSHYTFDFIFDVRQRVKSKLPAYLTTPLIRVKGIAKHWLISGLHLWRASKEKSKLLAILFDFTFTEVKGVSKEVIYLATSSTRVKGKVKANTIFDVTFDACQKCSKYNFSSRVST